LKSRNVPALNRVHEEPNPENIATLNRFIFNFGGAKPLTGGKLQKRISKALEQFKGTPVEPVINMITLRSMKQAKYSPEPLGHFGLGFDDYVHFTSPIRRYPDLVIHRQVKSLILKSDKYRTIGLSTMESMGVILSACEQRSVKAERQLLSIKKARMMENSLGEEYQGVISSVTRFGIFVLLREFDVDGLVKLDALGNDKFTFDEETLALVGKKSGLRYQIGDELRIKVASVDTQAGQIDFVLVGEKPVGNTQHRSAARQEPKKRGKAKRDRGRSR
jgi:ribonuclease R